MSRLTPAVQRRQELVAEYCEKMPNTLNRTVARALHEHYPRIFVTLESARTSVRNYRGQNGKASKVKAEKRGTYRKVHPPLPDTYMERPEAFEFHEKRVGVMSDLHIPFHDNNAIKKTLAYWDKYKPTGILINGDLLDFYAISRYDKRPDGPDAAEELQKGREFFEHIRSRFPRSRIVYRLGNHDERYENYLCAQAPALWKVDAVRFSWQLALGVDDLGVEVVKDKRKVMIGKLLCLHGHETRGIASGVNPARSTRLKLMVCTLTAHAHRSAMDSGKDAHDTNITCWAMGAMCGLKPMYDPYATWDAGFATVDVSSGGDFHCRIHRIINGTIR